MNLPCLVSTTVKTEKTETKYQDWLNALTYLYPNKVLCPNSLQCFDDCLKASGRLTMNKKKMIARTKLFYQDFDVFFSILLGELHKVHQKAKKKNKKFAYRPNGTSDTAKIVKKLLSLPKHQQPFDVLYDYTKIPQRVIEFIDNDSYHLTFSYDGTNDNWASYFLKNKICNVSVVFDVKRGESLPTHHIIGNNAYQVIDADLDDLRHKDIKQVICGLRAKGKATKNIDKGGSFVQKPIKLLKEKTMNLYIIKGEMRKEKAIGIFYHNTVVINADNEKEAWDKFNKNWNVTNHAPKIERIQNHAKK